jgi:hypothetical protein
MHVRRFAARTIGALRAVAFLIGLWRSYTTGSSTIMVISLCLSLFMKELDEGHPTRG